MVSSDESAPVQAIKLVRISGGCSPNYEAFEQAKSHAGSKSIAPCWIEEPKDSKKARPQPAGLCNCYVRTTKDHTCCPSSANIVAAVGTMLKAKHLERHRSQSNWLAVAAQLDEQERWTTKNIPPDLVTGINCGTPLRGTIRGRPPLHIRCSG